VVVLDVSDQQVEVLRIEENLRRRGLKPSETARALRRLYELHGITQGKHTPAKRPVSSSPGEDEETPQKTVAEVARDAGVGLTKASMLNRLADLIDPLMQRLDAGSITQKMAYGFAQLPPAEQEDIWETDDGALARRNLQDEQRSYLRGKYWDGIKQRGRPNKEANIAPFSTLPEVAARENVSPRTVKNDSQYAAAVDTLERNVPGARETILAGESGLPKAEVVKLAKKPRAEQQVARGLRHRGSGTPP